MLHMKRRSLLATFTGLVLGQVATGRAAGPVRPGPDDEAPARGGGGAAVGRADATLVLLDRFAAAWNAHDVDTLMACMTDDGVFESAAGATVAGTRSVGAAAVRKAYQSVFDTYPDARWNEPRHFVAGDRAVTEWRFTGTTREGQKVEVNGCDVFTLRGGRIALKNSYRKQRA